MDLKSVFVGVGTDYNFAPAQVFRVELDKISFDLTLQLDAAADNFKQVDDYIVFKYLVIRRLRQLSVLPRTGIIA